MNQLWVAVIFSILPVTELRVGLPIAVNYAIKNNVSLFPVFLLIVMANIAVIFLIFLFLDLLHGSFMKIDSYKKMFGSILERKREKINKFEKSFGTYGFLALMVFVAVPLPGTGAWTGSLIAWFLGLDRKKSIAAISLGVIIAGILMLLASLGVAGLISLI